MKIAALAGPFGKLRTSSDRASRLFSSSMIRTGLPVTAPPMAFAHVRILCIAQPTPIGYRNTASPMARMGTAHRGFIWRKLFQKSQRWAVALGELLGRHLIYVRFSQPYCDGLALLKIAPPTTPAISEATKIPTFATDSEGVSPKAKPAIKRDMVKPMPASQLAP